jgi:hypothetical protein
VRLITEKAVRQWIVDHPSVKAQLTYWLEKIKTCTATNFIELQALFAGVERHGKRNYENNRFAVEHARKLGARFHMTPSLFLDI